MGNADPPAGEKRRDQVDGVEEAGAKKDPLDEAVRALRLTDPEAEDNVLAGEVAGRRYAGEATFYAVDMAIGGRLVVAAGHDAAVPGDRVAVGPRPGGPLPRLFAETGE